MKMLAPAKINLSLEILGKLPSGYHEVDMIMQTVDLYDEIEIKINSREEINVSCNKNLNCPPEKNLAYKAAKLFLDRIKIKKGIEINIIKNIPVCAGLAGGSSNAAAVLVGLNKIFGTQISNIELLDLAKTLGSDVPFCLFGGTARATRQGTDLENISSLPNCAILIVKPSISISTKEAYKKTDKLKFTKKFKTENLINGIYNQNLNTICENLFNRFEDVSENKIITDIKQKLLLSGAERALMSGSGPSVFGIFKSESEAQNGFLKMKKVFPEVFLCSPVNHGAKILFN